MGFFSILFCCVCAKCWFFLACPAATAAPASSQPSLFCSSAHLLPPPCPLAPHNRKLRFPRLPCIDTSTTPGQPKWFPMELCTVIEGQRKSKLDAKQMAEMIKAAAQKPAEKKDYVGAVLQQLLPQVKPQLDQWGLEIKGEGGVRGGGGCGEGTGCCGWGRDRRGTGAGEGVHWLLLLKAVQLNREGWCHGQQQPATALSQGDQ